MARRCLSRGYTLIEVLIAMAIFSSMMFLATAALNQGLRQYHGIVEKGLDFWRNVRFFWIEKSFSSATDYYMSTRENGWTPYFIGNQDVVSYVSLSPLVGDLPVVVWLKNEKGEDGKRSLVYYELPVYTKVYQDIERAYILGDYRKGNSFKFLEGIENVEVDFYGYDLVLRKSLWYNDYDARKRKLLPSVVKISFSKNGHKGIFVFETNVNSMMKANYNELYVR